MTEKPVPPQTSDSAPFRAGCAAGELRYQRCGACGQAQFPPSPHCRACGTMAPAWQTSDMRGTIYSLTVVHRPPTSAFADDCPYILALVDLSEGFRMLLNVVGPNAQNARIGDAVHIIFESRGGDVVLPQAELG